MDDESVELISNLKIKKSHFFKLKRNDETNVPKISIFKFKHVTLYDMAKIVSNSKINELFILDYDETLVTKYKKICKLVDKCDKKYESNKKILLPGFDELLLSLKDKNFVILTQRRKDGIKNVKNFLSTFGFHPKIFSNIIYDENQQLILIPKGVVLMDIINSNPNCSVFHFLDDLQENLDSAISIVKNTCKRDIELNIYLTGDLYFLSKTFN